MNLSFYRRLPPTLIRVLFLVLVTSSVNGALLGARTTPDSQGLRVTVDAATGDYAIGQLGTASDVLKSTIAAKVDGHWLHARDYPKHTIRSEEHTSELQSLRQ